MRVNRWKTQRTCLHSIRASNCPTHFLKCSLSFYSAGKSWTASTLQPPKTSVQSKLSHICFLFSAFWLMVQIVRMYFSSLFFFVSYPANDFSVRFSRPVFRITVISWIYCASYYSHLNSQLSCFCTLCVRKRLLLHAKIHRKATPVTIRRRTQMQTTQEVGSKTEV